MKYMGSKRTLLLNGLGTIIEEHGQSYNRIVDLFCGASSVSWFAAKRLRKHVFACDLQEYAVVLAAAVIERLQPADWTCIEREWLSPARATLNGWHIWKDARNLDCSGTDIVAWQKEAQELCRSNSDTSSFLVFRCYGGYYFSPTQALAFDAMLDTLPSDRNIRQLCLAAAIIAASNCAASPGHTAQPFKATKTASKYLLDAWQRDPFAYASKALKKLAPLHAHVLGKSLVGDANEIANDLSADDLVFIDPPYSAVQYSRFYHVLETIARGRCSSVSGEGRYPPRSERPESLYSQRSKSQFVISDLLAKLASNGCTVVMTFPESECSNGLSGVGLESIAQQYFRVERKTINSKFSTLGGNTIHRMAREHKDEFILILTMN